MDRFEKFNNFVAQLATCKRVSKFISLFLELIKDVVHCEITSVFAFKSELIDSRNKIKDIIIQKTVLDGKYVDMVGLSQHPI